MSSRKRGQRQMSEEPSDESEDDKSSTHGASKRARVEDTTMSEPDHENSQLEMRYTQRIREQNSNTRHNEPAEGGVVTEVICENFMCHRYLRIEFGPFMNFIIGHNGSGKSAILTALTLCLGGKASSTNRGNAMKTFIKEGEDTARVTVKLKNGGDGYRPDAYGTIITIERLFGRDGCSQYKLKSKEGKTVSTKKEELDNITDFYGLQVDNPMTVLTQDQARQFLSSSSNSDKYKFFNRGVQLEQLDQDYSLVATAIKNTEAMLETKKEGVLVLKGKLGDAERKLKQFESHDGLRDRMRTLKHQMVWVQVRDAQLALQKQDERIEAVRQKIAATVQRRDRAAEDYEAVDRELAAADERIKEEQQKLEPYREEKADLLERLNANKADLLGLQADQRQQRPLIQSNESKIRELELKIDEEEKRLAERNGGSSARLTESIDSAQEEISRIKTQIDALEEQHKTNQAEFERASHAKSRLKESIESKEQDLEQRKELLHQLGSTEKDSLSAFDRRMRLLVQEIEKERGFRQKPIGPLGRYVTLLDNKWMDIVEQFFGNTLGAFVVTSHTDAELLRRVMSKVNYTVQFFVTPAKNITPVEPAERFKTILRILDVSDPTARMQLIVGHSAEQAILIEDLQQANTVMKSRREGDHIGQCFALNARHPGMGHRVGGAIGVSSVTPVQRWPRATRMAQKSNGPSQKENVQENIRRIEGELKELRLDYSKVEREVNSLQSALQRHRSLRRGLNTEISRHEDKIDQLRSRIDAIAADGNLGVFQEQITLAKQDRETYQKQAKELSERKQELEREQNEISASLKGSNQDLELGERRLKDAEADKTSIQSRRTEALKLKNQLIDKEVKYNAVMAECQEGRSILANTVEVPLTSLQETFHLLLTNQDHTGKAQEACPQVEVPEGETWDTLRARCRLLALEVAEAEKLLGVSKEECTAEYCALAAEYTANNALCAGFDQLLLTATNVLSERKRRWGLFQSYISARARAQFSWMMSERAFKGRLRLEHAKRPPELIIEVQPGSEATGNRGPKTLSGGEKSFSTICLLLSLWEAMGSPIRCLDEFDVFMDSVNRSISVKMMIKSAERSVGKQFILITPQNMHQATSTQCKITRMPDPDRGGGRQTILS